MIKLFSYIFPLKKDDNNPYLKNDALDRVTLMLLFLFPVGATYIRHWLSFIFVILFFYSCFYLVNKKNIKNALDTEEKFLLLIFFLHFCIFLISAIYNGWGKNQVYAIGLELRFLVIIPMYFMLRNIPDGIKFLLAGSIFGLLFSFLEGFFEKIFLNADMITGIYGHLFIGPITVLFMFMGISWLYFNNVKNYIYYYITAFYVFGVYVSVYSIARSSYLAVLCVSALLLFFKVPKKYFIFSVLFFCGMISLAYFGSERIKSRVDFGVSDLAGYFASKDKVNSKTGGTSLELRLQTWRSAQFFLKDYTFLGIGQGNFIDKMSGYIADGKVHQAVSRMPHAHNVFIEAVINRGILGLIVVLLLFFYPLYLYIKYQHIDKNLAQTGILFIACITIFSLTESAPLIKNNFVAIFLLYSTTIFSAFINIKRNKLHSRI